MPCSKICRRCGDGEESTLHALVYCVAIGEVWDRSIFGRLVLDLRRYRTKDFFLNAQKNLNRDDFSTFATLLWSSWFERNKFTHGGRQKSATMVLEDAGSWLYNYQKAQRGFNIQTLSIPPNSKKWQPPPNDSYKLNVDASVLPGVAGAGLGAIIRNDAGFVLGAMAKKVEGISSPYLAEVLALREGLQFARESMLQVRLVESDSSLAITNISNSMNLAPEGLIFADIRQLLSVTGGGTCSAISRYANGAAHTLARFALAHHIERYWLEETPDCISQIVLNDLS